MAEVLEDTWGGLYKNKWKDIATAACHQHPAKFAKDLAFKLVDHAIECGWLIPGVSTVVDPFGGVGLGGLPCALQGIQWIGQELESRFYALAHGVDCPGDLAKHEACSDTEEHGPHHIPGNFELWERKYGALPQWKPPILIQGDSRRLREVLREAGISISSPPFAGSQQVDNRTKSASAMSGAWRKHFGSITDGHHPQQLANLPTGSFDATIVSPPYADGCTHTGGTDPHPEHIQGGPLRYVQYRVDCGVTSPPWENQLVNHDTPKGYQQFHAKVDGNKPGRSVGQDYGTHLSQLGNTQGDTFWEASKTILQQLYSLIVPGGHAIFVTKSYVRDNKIVPFPDQWRRLAEHVGFVTLHIHYAMQVDRVTAHDLFGDDTAMYHKEYKGFFRRDNERKGAPKIDFEVVLCMVKPDTTMAMPPDEAWEHAHWAGGSQ